MELLLSRPDWRRSCCSGGAADAAGGAAGARGADAAGAAMCASRVGADAPSTVAAAT
jgi:hypothetical protein